MRKASTGGDNNIKLVLIGSKMASYDNKNYNNEKPFAVTQSWKNLCCYPTLELYHRDDLNEGS